MTSVHVISCSPLYLEKESSWCILCLSQAWKYRSDLCSVRSVSVCLCACVWCQDPSPEFVAIDTLPFFSFSSGVEKYHCVTRQGHGTSWYQVTWFDMKWGQWYYLITKFSENMIIALVDISCHGGRKLLEAARRHQTWSRGRRSVWRETPLTVTKSKIRQHHWTERTPLG